MLTEQLRQQLKDVAQRSVRYGLDHHAPLPVHVDDYRGELIEIKASFVTLHMHHDLRGCIGTLEAYRPLVVDIAENAFAAAFRDPRFAPLMEHEFNQLSYHISILSRPVAMTVSDEQDLLDQLQPGIDGIVLYEGARRSTFLPSVWESLATPQQFIEHLKLKAGLDRHHWSDRMRFERYRVEEF